MPLVVDQIPLGPIETNCYVVRASTSAPEAVVVDPGGDATGLRLELARMGTRCAAILITHGHWDHLGGVADLAEGTGAKVYMAEDERGMLESPLAPTGVHVRAYTPDVLLAGGETLELAGIELEVLNVPGHSPAHLAYAADDCLLSGDVLFAGGVGRVDIPGGDWDTLVASIRLLAERFPPETIVYSGHGPPTTIGRELATNPFLAELCEPHRPVPQHDPSRDRAAVPEQNLAHIRHRHVTVRRVASPPGTAAAPIPPRAGTPPLGGRPSAGAGPHPGREIPPRAGARRHGRKRHAPNEGHPAVDDVEAAAARPSSEAHRTRDVADAASAGPGSAAHRAVAAAELTPTEHLRRATAMSRFDAPKGTHDLLPSDRLWWRAVREIERLLPLYGYGRIQTPVFEDTDLVHRTSGAGSDVVQKETYTFEDRGGRSLTLRPEGTAPIVRAYLERGLHREAKPQKLFTIATMYRYSAPQRGRYREHTQLSAEVIGAPGPAVDAELIQLYDELLRRLGVTAYELQLNSIGDQVCRPAYLESLNAWLDAHAEVLDDEARGKRATTPLRVFDVKNERVLAALADAPKIGESLCPECAEHYAEVKRHLDSVGVAYKEEPTLVRGLDYYSRTTFEFKDTLTGAAQDTICGGGRYDGLVEQLGGDPTPGIGFGAGLERLVLAMEDAGVTEPPVRLDVFLVGGGDLLPLATELRRAGVSADLDHAGRSRNAQLKHAQRLDAKRIAIVEDGMATIRARNARDVQVPVGELVASLAAARATDGG